MDTINDWLRFLLVAGMVVDAVVLCMIYRRGTYPKKRKTSDEKSMLTVVYRVPIEGKSAG